MTHKDAPPETPSQIACREWWTKAQPHITRVWGRDKHGNYFAEESRLLHKAWSEAFDAGRNFEHGHLAAAMYPRSNHENV